MATRLWMTLLLLIAAAPVVRAQDFPCSSLTPVIMDDDMANDTDALAGYYTAAKWEDLGCVGPILFMADSSNTYGAGVEQAVASYAKHPDIVISANQQNTPNNSNCGSSCNSSNWTSSTVATFNPGAVRTNFPSCDIAARQFLANVPNASAVWVMTGYTPCITQFLATSGDSISPLTGVQLAQQKIKYLVVEAGGWVGGDDPSPEANAYNDAPGYNSLFTTWTSQNGYPPLWIMDYSLGSGIVCAGVPVYQGTSVVVGYAVRLHNLGGCIPGYTSAVFDQIGLMMAAWGLSHNGTTYFQLNTNGTGTVNATTGIATFSTATASGQYLLTIPGGGLSGTLAPTFINLFDGYTCCGLTPGSNAAALAPLVKLGTLSTGVTFKGITEK